MLMKHINKKALARRPDVLPCVLTTHSRPALTDRGPCYNGTLYTFGSLPSWSFVVILLQEMMSKNLLYGSVCYWNIPKLRIHSGILERMSAFNFHS